MTTVTTSNAQDNIRVRKISALSDSIGFAGMFAGESKGILFCMGGANFPDKMPWNGGVKKWYSHIYKFQNNVWTRVQRAMNSPLAYGVSVCYKDEIILIGGNNESGQSDKVTGYTWQEGDFSHKNYPDLPQALANMCGAIVGNYIILTGGTQSNTGLPLKTSLLLDMENSSVGWQKIDTWPGPERMLAVCGVYQGAYYLFGGENSTQNLKGEKTRHILSDAYRFIPEKKGLGYSVHWERLSNMPRGISAGAFPLPYIAGQGFIFWGGVDPVTALHTDPITHPGLLNDFLVYDSEKDRWKHLPGTGISGRVTLPVVKVDDCWLYISGEVRPGVRTPDIYSIY